MDRKRLIGFIYLVSLNLGTKAKGRFINRPTTTGGKKYDKYFVYIPTDVAKDSAFPFRVGEEVQVSIDSKHKRLVVDKSG